MQSITNFLGKLGPIGTFLANTLSFLTANWGLTLTTAVSLYAALSDALTDFFHKGSVQTFIFVFLVGLWTYIGILRLLDRNKPQVTTPAHDYRYGLTYEGIIPILDPFAGTLAFGVQIRNFSSGPIKYIVEKFEISLETRSLKAKKGELYGYLARGGGKISNLLPFKKSELEEFKGKTIEGSAEIIFLYGHPEMPAERRLKLTLKLTLVFNVDANGNNAALGFGGNVAEEVDEAINIPQ